MTAEALKEQIRLEIVVQMTRRGVSKADLAKHLGVSRSAVTQMLSAGNTLSLDTIAKISAALRCDISVAFVQIR